ADPAVRLVTDSAAIAYGVIAEQAAASRLHKAIEYANPTVRAVADLVAKDISDLRRLNAASMRQALARIDMDTPDLPRLNTLVQARSRLGVSTPADRASMKEYGELIDLE